MEDKYYITLKSNNEFQIRVFHTYEDQTPIESMNKVNDYLKSIGKQAITINEYKSYEEANEVLNQMCPYDNNGINIDYELRKYFKYIMSEEEKKELNKVINNFIETSAYKRYQSLSREGLKIKLNCELKKIIK